MSATDQIRAQLAELMGSSYLGTTEQAGLKFDDPNVCKPFLLACCPHEILQSTKFDIGECPKIHELALRADYEAAVKQKEYDYELDAYDALKRIVDDCDRRVENGRRKVREMQAAEESSAESQELVDKMHELGEQIGTKLAKAEELGLQGQVADSMQLMEDVEKLKLERTQVESQYKSTIPATAYQQQKLRVCEVCSAFLGIHDNDRRLADHFGGRLHLGFIRMRDRLDELRGIVALKKDKRDSLREERRRERDRSPRSSRRGSRSTSRDRERDRDREYRSRRSRSRSRSRRRDRSRSRDRRTSKKRSKHSRRSRTRSP